MNPEVFENCSTILIDIAGTVGSINFTKDTLFAFAKKNIEEYLSAKWEDEEVKKLVAELKGDGDELADVAKAVERFNALTDENSVNTGLKTLQGLLYKQGYENGELKAHVFDDIKTALEEWSKHRKICIYSTGAEEAQKQYFTHSTAGDLHGFIANYFDQTIGKKTASDSYESIAKKLEVKPSEIVFLSDDIEEIKAAATAGCTPVLVTREGNAEVSEDDKKDRLVVTSFADLPLTAAKRKIDEASSEEPPKKLAKLDSTTQTKESETKTEEAKTETKVEDKEAKKVEAETESMEVDSSETTAPPTTAVTEETNTDKATNEVAVETKEKESSEVKDKTVEAKTDSTDSAKVESTTEDKADTAESTDKTDDATTTSTTSDATASTTTDVPVEKMDDTPASTTETTEKPVEKTDEPDAKKTEVEKEAEPAVPVTETKAEEEKEKQAEPESTKEPETTEVATAEVKQNGKAVAEENKAEENGKTNGDATEATNNADVDTEEKENKRDVANGTAEEKVTEEKKGEEVAKEAVTEEVKVKKIEDATETAASLPVEA